MPKRQLVAIMCLDLVGYSRLMGADEEGTLAQFEAVRRDVLVRLIGEHGGRVFKTTGDGLLAEFAGPVDAVRCAVSVQRAVAERNADQAAEQRFEFRVG